MKNIPLLLACAALLSGCAFGNHFDYKSVRAPLPVGKPVSVAVAIVDSRGDVLSGDIKNTYVGITRDGFGIPFRAYTKSGQPFSSDLSDALADSLNAAGYKAKAMTGFPVSNSSAAMSSLRASGANRLLLVTVKQWESDTLIRTELDVNVMAQVYSATGALLATTSYAAQQNLGGDAMVPEMHAREQLLAETGRMLASILTNPQISRSLNEN